VDGFSRPFQTRRSSEREGGGVGGKFFSISIEVDDPYFLSFIFFFFFSTRERERRGGMDICYYIIFPPRGGVAQFFSFFGGGGFLFHSSPSSCHRREERGRALPKCLFLPPFPYAREMEERRGRKREGFTGNRTHCVSGRMKKRGERDLCIGLYLSPPAIGRKSEDPTLAASLPSSERGGGAQALSITSIS